MNMPPPNSPHQPQVVQPPYAPPKKSSAWKWILIVGGLLLLLCGGGIGGCALLVGGAANEVSKEIEKTEEKRNRKIEGSIGKPIKNAGTTYTVVSAAKVATLGDPSLGGSTADAGGTFVVVTLKLLNEKNDSRVFSDSSAKLVARDGTEYETTSKAALEFGEQDLMLKDIQPDLPTTGKLAFEVPTAKLAGATLEIEDLFGDGRISVPLEL